MRGITRAIWLLLPLLVISASLTIASSEEMRAGVVTGIQGTAKVTRASLAEPRDLVVQPTSSGIRAKRLACRAGAWPIPAGSTQPMMTSST